MSNEWIWAIAICATPFLVFAAIELGAFLRRRQYEAVARRPKERNFRRG